VPKRIKNSKVKSSVVANKDQLILGLSMRYNNIPKIITVIEAPPFTFRPLPVRAAAAITPPSEIEPMHYLVPPARNLITLRIKK
jgi:hypothetical protein